MLFACICFLSFFTQQQPGTFPGAPAAALHFSGCPGSAPLGQQEERGNRASWGWGRCGLDPEEQQRTSSHDTLLLLSIPGQARTLGQFVKTCLYCTDHAIAIREPHPIATLPRVGDPARAWHGGDAERVPVTQASSKRPAFHPTPISAGPEAGSTWSGGLYALKQCQSWHHSQCCL